MAYAMLTQHLVFNTLFGVIEEKSASGSLLFDVRTGTSTYSSGFYQLFGLNPAREAITAGVIEALVHPFDLQDFLRGSAEAVLATGLPTEVDFRILRRDRTLRWISAKSEIIHSEGGAPASALTVFVDITKQKQAVDRAIRYENNTSVLADKCQFLTWVVGADGVKPDTPFWRPLTGQSRRDSLGAGWLDAIHPDDREATRLAMQKALKSQSIYVARYRLRRANGEYLWFAARMAPVLNADYSVRGWLGAGIDIDDMPLSQPATPFGPDSPDALQLTGAHIRAARGALNWSVRDLAEAANLTPPIVRGLEELRYMTGNSARVRAMVAALDAAGVGFSKQPGGDIAVVFKSSQSH
eukprot:gene22138-23193_t